MREIAYIVTLLLSVTQTIPQADIEEKERELKEIRGRLVQCREEQKRLDGKEATLLQKLEGIDKQLNLTHRMLSQLDEKKKRTETDIGILEGKIRSTERTLEEKQRILGRRLVTIYKKGQVHPWDVLLSSRNFTDGFRRIKYLTLIAKQDRRVCDQVRSLRDRLGKEKSDFAAKLVEMLQVREETEKEEKNMGTDKRKKRRLLTKVRGEREEQEKIAKELRAAEKKLQNLIEELERKRREELARSGGPAGVHDFQSHRGRLIWPTEGDVISYFGRQFHPRYGTSTRNNGIDIRAPMDAPVVAIGDGVIAYADRFLGYGEIALIDHGGGYYTLYAHLSQSMVEVGDEVRMGDLIARVGETGSLEGPVLHFELRVDGRPVDPLPWLRRR